jgi:hypothetical protein
VKPQPTLRLGADNRLLVNLTATGVWASGVLWLLFHYFMVHTGEFGPERSPLEPWWLKIHGAFAFLSLWSGGVLWGLHVVNGWRQKRRRWSGATLFGCFLVLILTGYLLYYVGDDQPRAMISIIHWILGLAAPLVFASHRLIPMLARRRDQVRSSS